MASVFISYVEEDSSTAVAIARALEAASIRTWYYERDSIPGPPYIEQVVDALVSCRVVLVVISPSSLGSRQVEHEIWRAYETGKPFVPVLKDTDLATMQKRARILSQCLGAATAVSISTEALNPVLPRIVTGVRRLLETRGSATGVLSSDIGTKPIVSRPGRATPESTNANPETSTGVSPLIGQTTTTSRTASAIQTRAQRASATERSDAPKDVANSKETNRTATITDIGGNVTEFTNVNLGEGRWFKFHAGVKGFIVLTRDFEVTIPQSSLVSVIRNDVELELTYLVGEHKTTIRGKLECSVISGYCGGAIVNLLPAKLKSMVFVQPAVPYVMASWPPTDHLASVHLVNGATLTITNPERYTLHEGRAVIPGPGGKMLRAADSPTFSAELSWKRGEIVYSAALKELSNIGKIEFTPGTNAVIVVMPNGETARATCTKERYGGFEGLVGDSEYGRLFIDAGKIKSIAVTNHPA